VPLPASESPVEITVSADEHLPASASGISFGSGETVTQDFTLELEAACPTVDPGSLSFALPAGESDSQALTIGNGDGNAELAWTIEEAPAVDTQAHFPVPTRYVEHKDPQLASRGHDPAAESGTDMTHGPQLLANLEVPAYSTTG